jgi:hypothetical protein
MQGGGSRQPDMKFPAAKTLEKYNPAALMVDKRKKLSLADSQVALFNGMRSRIFERNALLLAHYDSLQRDFRPPRMAARNAGANDPAADSTRRAAMFQMRQLRQLVDSLEDRRRTDVRDVLSALNDETQRKKAADFLDKQDVEFSKEFPAPPLQRREGDPGGPDGMGRGGRRPPA